MKQANVIIQNSTISDLNLTGVSAPIVVDSGTLAVANSTFIHNTAPLSGGIAASDMQAVTLDSCTFINSYGEVLHQPGWPSYAQLANIHTDAMPCGSTILLVFDTSCPSTLEDPLFFCFNPA